MTPPTSSTAHRSAGAGATGESRAVVTNTGRWYDRSLASALALGVVLFAAAQLTDPGGYLSTDVGGKTATLEVIVNDGPSSPDIGYWAEELDPDGSLHPMSNTKQLEGVWVNVTTLPMIYAAAPLYALGGLRLAMLLPVLGTVFAAAAARSLAGQLGGDQRHQTLSFWLVGLASPATIYALDFWEHSLGLAFMAWGVVAVVHASQAARVSAWVPIGAGLTFACAASMRQEALIYGFVAGVAVVARLGLARRFVDAGTRGVLMIAGTAAGLAANAALEWIVFGAPLRAGRSGRAAGAAGANGLVRLKEAIVSGVSPVSGHRFSTYVLAITLAVLLVAIGSRADEPDDRQLVLRVGLLAIGVVVALDLLVDGLRFIPGLLATTPVAAFGLARGWQVGSRRMVTLIAAGAPPLVWYSQYTGGQAPQWGGRYILASGLLLLVVGIVSCEGEQARRTLRLVAGAGAVVTAVGVAWTVYRTDSFADASRVLADRPEQALVFENSSLSREAGPLLLDETWLAASNTEDRAEAVALLEAAGIDEVGLVAYDDGREGRDLPGWVATDITRVPLVNDLELIVTTWIDPG